MTTSRRQAQGDLEAVVDEPLKGGEGANHGNSHWQAVPEAFETDVAVDPGHGFPRALAGYGFVSAHPVSLMLTDLRFARDTHTLSVGVQLADHDIGRVTDDGTSDPRDIPTQETHPGLLQRVVALLGFPQRSVDVIDRRLKGREFHHCVWDLPAP